MFATNPRNCQPCTACCEGWLKIEAPQARAHLGKACSHCSQQGCAIYSTRPQEPCQSFHCAWRQEDTPLPLNMRPDLSGAIVLLNQLEWQEEEVIVAIATGSRIPARTFHWLCSLAKITARPLAAVEYTQDADGFNGEFNLRTIGSEEFRLVMVKYFARQGFTSTHVTVESRVLEMTAP